MRLGFGILPIAIGFGLLWLSNSLEFQGDLSVAPTDRLLFHGLALLALLIALACFLRGLWSAWRFLANRASASTKDLTEVFAEESSFDADGALARYLERKRDDASPPSAPATSPPGPRGGTFGRKGT